MILLEIFGMVARALQAQLPVDPLGAGLVTFFPGNDFELLHDGFVKPLGDRPAILGILSVGLSQRSALHRSTLLPRTL